MSSRLLFLCFFLPVCVLNGISVDMRFACISVDGKEWKEVALTSSGHHVQERVINSCFVQAMAMLKGLDLRGGVQLRGRLWKTFLVCGHIVRWGDLSAWAQREHQKLNLSPMKKGWIETSRGSQPSNNLVNIYGQTLVLGWKWNEDQELGIQTDCYTLWDGFS